MAAMSPLWSPSASRWEWLTSTKMRLGWRCPTPQCWTMRTGPTYSLAALLSSKRRRKVTGLKSTWRWWGGKTFSTAGHSSTCLSTGNYHECINIHLDYNLGKILISTVGLCWTARSPLWLVFLRQRPALLSSVAISAQRGGRGQFFRRWWISACSRTRYSWCTPPATS